MNKLLDFLFSSAASVWFFFAGKPKQLVPAPEYRHVWEDDSPELEVFEEPNSNVNQDFLNALHTVKRELENPIITPVMQKAIDKAFKESIPNLYRKALLEKNGVFLVSATDLKIDYKDDEKGTWFKVRPIIMNRLKDSGIQSELNASYISLRVEDLEKAMKSHDAAPIPEMNSIGIYR